MQHRLITLALLPLALAATPATAADFERLPPAELGEKAPDQAQSATTLTGIPLDAQWKQKLYAFAREKLKHPAWGWTHSERDYLLATEIAEKEGLAIQSDVLFAAAFAHDIGAIGEFQKEGVDHAVRSVEIAEPWLRSVGFPVEKLPAVREAILGHMHDKVPGKGNEAIVLHDADTLDFLGAVGVARRLAVTGEATDYSPGVGRIREFAERLPGRLATRAARSMASPRIAEMRSFLTGLDAETAGGRIP
jgi:uncharacterized protein